MTTLAKDIRINNNCYGENLAEVLGIDPNAELKWLGDVSRWVGTGYYDAYYHILGTDDVAVVVKNNHSMKEGFWDSAYIDPSYFSSRRDYGKICGKLARRFHLPLGVVLAVGPDHVEEYAYACDMVNPGFIQDWEWELSCGIYRRKQAIFACFGEFLSEELRNHIESMGQVHSTRIARHLLSLGGYKV